MKRIRIFALPSHASKDRTSGVDFARVIQPANHLNGFTYKGYKFEVHVHDVLNENQRNWIEIAQNYDVFFFNYTANPWGFAAMGAMARHFKRPMIMDVDDNLWELTPDNPAYKVYQKGSQALHDFTAICNEVDYITTTSLYLKHVIIHHTKQKYENLKVFPNYVDLKIYNHRCKFKNDGQIQLLHHGSTTHFIDLYTEEFAKGIDRIMKEYPNVTFKTVGAFISKYKYMWGQRYTNDFGDVDIYKWIEKAAMFMDESDILVVPLDNNKYTRCKSDIKYSETSSFKIPGVYQKIRQYEETIDNGVNGFLAETSDEWYNSLKVLIDNPEKRKKMGEEAFKTVKDTKQIELAVPDYAKMFLDILTK